MTKIAEQDYDYDKLKSTFKNVSDAVDKNLEKAGINIKRSEGFFTSIGNWFKDLFSGSKDLGILENTNDQVLGDDVKVDATDKDVIKEAVSNEGFWSRIRSWFSNLFNSSNKNDSEKSEDNTNSADLKNKNDINSNSENTSSDINNINENNTDADTHSEKDLQNSESNNSESLEENTESSTVNTQN